MIILQPLRDQQSNTGFDNPSWHTILAKHGLTFQMELISFPLTSASNSKHHPQKVCENISSIKATFYIYAIASALLIYHSYYYKQCE